MNKTSARSIALRMVAAMAAAVFLLLPTTTALGAGTESHSAAEAVSVSASMDSPATSWAENGGGRWDAGVHAGKGGIFKNRKNRAATIYTNSLDNDLASLLRKEGFRVVCRGSVREILSHAGKGSAVILAADGYPDSPLSLSDKDISAIREKDLRVFAEYATLPGEKADIGEIGVERVVVTAPIGDSLHPMDLLSINRAAYLKKDATDPLMVIARVAGFDTAVFGLDGTPCTPLVYRDSGNLLVSTSKLSDFARLRLMPESRWKPFWEAVISELTGKAVSFRQWPTAIAPAYSQDAPLPRNARKQAIRKGIEWFFNGHFLIHPDWKESWVMKYIGDGTMPVGPELPEDAPDGDGSLGVLEGHCSAIYKDGRQAYRYWIRDDIQGESSMAFALAGELLGNQEYRRIAERLSDYSFKEFQDGPRSDPESPTYGLLGWAYTHKWVYYGDDNARSILGTILASKVLGTHRWDKNLDAAIEANFNTTGKNGFRGPRLHEQDIQANGLDYYRNGEAVNPHPHFESWLWACYLWQYASTGDRKYFDKAEKGISMTMAAYPDLWHWTNGIQQERARMVLPLAWLYRVSPTEEHKAWLERITSDIARNQVECGAIREELGDPSKGSFGAERCNADYGQNEAPLIFRNGDPVADMLYTCNFAVFALNEAACATGDPKIRKMADSLGEFLVRIQVRSESRKNVDGAWFRAFNYRNWDYWASNADAGWGAQSTLTGWIQSWIVATLALMEKGTSFWDVTLP